MIAPGSTAFALMTNGASVLCGVTTMHSMSKSWTITKEFFYEQKDFPTFILVKSYAKSFCFRLA